MKPAVTVLMEPTAPLHPAVDMFDITLRLLAAVAAGMLVGFDREWRGKPLGIRTLALVSLGSALACVTTVHLRALQEDPDAVSRVVQGVVTGIMTGVGFLGAGAVLQRRGADHVEGLTTAATVWVTAALGIACGLANWGIVAIGVGLTVIVLVAINPLDNWIERRRKRGND